MILAVWIAHWCSWQSYYKYRRWKFGDFWEMITQTVVWPLINNFSRIFGNLWKSLEIFGKSSKKVIISMYCLYNVSYMYGISRPAFNLYLTSECSKWVRCQIKQKRNLCISNNKQTLVLLLLYKQYICILMTTFLTIFRRFPYTFWWFLKDAPKVVHLKARQSFLWTFSESLQRLKIFEEELMFWSNSNTSKYFLRDYVTIAMVISF